MSQNALVSVSLHAFLIASFFEVVSGVNLTLGMDVDWKPYAYEEDGVLKGFGKDIADGLTELCDDVTIQVVKVGWGECWSSKDGGTLGTAIDNGTIDGCMTYTNTRGVRQTFAEFSHAILQENNAAGLLTMLTDGVPKVFGAEDLAGKKIVDVGGWAPTVDTIVDVTNKCTDLKYSTNLTMVVPSEEGNDAAMKMLRDGTADAMFVYSSQAANYQDCTGGGFDCDLWKGFGTEYAYVQTGQFGYTLNGTTLVLGKKDSGKAATVNACLEEYMQTKAYYDVCVKHSFVSTCYPNSFFPADSVTTPIMNKPTDEQTGTCCDGYCPCTCTANATSFCSEGGTCPTGGESTDGNNASTDSKPTATTSDAHQGAPLLTAFVFAAIWSWRA